MQTQPTAATVSHSQLKIIISFSFFFPCHIVTFSNNVLCPAARAYLSVQCCRHLPFYLSAGATQKFRAESQAMFLFAFVMGLRAVVERCRRQPGKCEETPRGAANLSEHSRVAPSVIALPHQHHHHPSALPTPSPQPLQPPTTKSRSRFACKCLFSKSPTPPRSPLAPTLFFFISQLGPSCTQIEKSNLQDEVTTGKPG